MPKAPSDVRGWFANCWERSSAAFYIFLRLFLCTIKEKLSCIYMVDIVFFNAVATDRSIFLHEIVDIVFMKSK